MPIDKLNYIKIIDVNTEIILKLLEMNDVIYNIILFRMVAI